MNTPIIMTEEYWMYTQLSIARRTGGIRFNGVEYIVVNKDGKDLFQCSIEAEKAGREKAIEPGEPADLIDKRYLKYYKHFGRDKFIEMVKDGKELKDFQKE